MRTPLRHILRIICSDDIFARHWMVHDGFRVWEEAVESPVEEACRDEGVYVSDVVAVGVGVC